MPEDSVYGAWPQSGEIDIMESRGNDGLIYRGGRNAVRMNDHFMHHKLTFGLQVGSTLHWGPNKQLDQFAKTSNSKYIRRRDFSDGFHTFGVEWSSNYIFTYLDSVLNASRYPSSVPCASQLIVYSKYFTCPLGRKWEICTHEVTSVI
jgi:beta-glucanase (GH16 family)